jgi:aspartyl-tRNA synthetase
MIGAVMNLDGRKQASYVNSENIGKEVVLAGFVTEYRNIGKNLKFIILLDWTGEAQVVFSAGKTGEEEMEKIKGVTNQSVVAIKGIIQKSSSEKFAAELLAKNIEIISRSDQQLPIDISDNTETTFSKRLNWRSLDLRKSENHSIFKIQSAFIKGIYNYLVNNEFIQIFTPCLLGTGSESGAEMFSVAYFDKEAFLRQDPQLHRQLTIAGGFEKIFEIGPSWRAEESHTMRHLCEHRGIAIEKAYINSEEDIMRLEEEVIISGLNEVTGTCKNELGVLGKKIEVPKKPFPEIRYPEIYDILEGLGKKIEFGKEHDWESEMLLARYIKEKYGSDFYFINRFPFDSKPFYVMRVDEDNMWARSVDMIYKGVELSSGGQREHRYDRLIENVNYKDMKSMGWFTDVFKYGVPPHGGFGMGVERVIMQLLDIKNVREATLYPRDPERLFP